jgi:Rod binding domain-containing protein
MGCKQSTPVKSDPMSMGKSQRGEPRTAGVGHSERLMSAQIRRMQASTANGAPPTVSLEVDEETTNKIPKLNNDGKLMPEEIVRRTSTSLNVTSIAIGNKDKGGKVVQVQVSRVSYLSFLFGPFT